MADRNPSPSVTSPFSQAAPLLDGGHREDNRESQQWKTMEDTGKTFGRVNNVGHREDIGSVNSGGHGEDIGSVNNGGHRRDIGKVNIHTLTCAAARIAIQASEL